MKKLLLTGAALAAAMMAGQASAVIPTLANGAPDIAAIRLAGVAEARSAGATAPTPFLLGAFQNNCLNRSMYRFNAGGTISVVCERGPVIAGVPQQFLMLHKTENGGSITGIRASQGTAFAFLTDAALTGSTCGALAANAVTTCTGVPNTTAIFPTPYDVNFADVDAAKFESPLNGNAANAGQLGSSAVAAQIFGVAVNLRFRNALQAVGVASGLLPAGCVGLETEACMPNLTTTQLSSLLGANRVTDWRNFRWGGTATTQTLFPASGNPVALADQPLNRDVHICNRTNGSGTLATQQVYFHNVPCFGGAEPLLSASSTTVGNETVGANGGVKVLHSMAGSGDVENCLQGLNDGTDLGGAPNAFNPYSTGRMLPAGAGANNFRWAIGVLSADRNANNAKPIRFIKIDGYAPTGQNVVKGNYRFWAELVNITTGVTSGTPGAALAADLLTNMRNPVEIANLNCPPGSLNADHLTCNVNAGGNFTWGVSGFLGIATSSAFPPTANAAIAPGIFLNGAYDTFRPVSVYTHGPASSSNGSGIDHCRVKTIPGGARAIPFHY